jgi:hypothetical protein
MFTKALIVLTVALGCVPAAASARPIDRVPPPQERSFASPDARDAALAHERYYSSYVNDGGAAAARIAARQDLRSPDTRDVAAGRKYPPTPTVVSLRPIEVPASVSADSFDWVAAVAGAGAAIGIMLLIMSGALLVVRRRAHRDQPVAVA